MTFQERIEEIQKERKGAIRDGESITQFQFRRVKADIELEALQEGYKLGLEEAGSDIELLKLQREQHELELKQRIAMERIKAKEETNNKVEELRIRICECETINKIKDCYNCRIIDQVFSNSQEIKPLTSIGEDEKQGSLDAEKVLKDRLDSVGQDKVIQRQALEAHSALHTQFNNQETKPIVFYQNTSSSSPDTQFKQGYDCFWIWDTEDDRKRAEQLEKRVKDQRTKEVIEIIDKNIDGCEDLFPKESNHNFNRNNIVGVSKNILLLIKQAIKERQ